MNFNTWSIFNKMMLFGLLAVVTVMALVGWVLTRQTDQAFMEQGRGKLQEAAFNTLDKLERHLFERYADVQSFAGTPAAKSMNPETIMELMRSNVRTYAPIYALTVVANTEGRIIAVNTVDVSGDPLPRARNLLGTDVSGEVWFQNSISGRVPVGQADVLDVRRDPLLTTLYGPENNLTVTYSAPIRNDQGRIVGVWSNRYNWEVARSILEELETQAEASGNETVRVGLLSKSGVALHAPNPGDLLNRNVSSKLNLDLGKQPNGSAETLNLGGSAEAITGWATSKGYSNYPGLGWVMVVSQDRAELQEASQGLVRTLVVSCALVVLVFGLLLWLIRVSIGHRLNSLATAAGSLAAGNLQVTLPPSSRDEIGRLRDAFERMTSYQGQMARIANQISMGEIGQAITPHGTTDVLGNAFTRMLENLRELVGEAQDTAHNLASASMQLQAASTQQAASINEQSAAVAETSATVEEVRVSSDQAVEMANTVSDNAQTAQQVVRAGVESTQAMIRDMQDIRKQVQDISAHILTLSESSQKIGDIIEVVSDLADQSNLLALNAAIEAHRAGEHGRGFVVVAQEIRNLAEQSKTATGQVRTILSGIQRDTNAAVMATERGTRVVDAGTQSISTLENTIGELAEAIEHAAHSAQVIAGSVKQHSYGMEQIALAMQNIQTASEQNLQASESNQQASRHLSDLASRLKKVIDRYRLKA